ncbi:YhdP family protein [Agarivorans aestuarii]|uniref:YhdP family protein n=1 Tax=Agarivorans aestuarii TaxID=1563703 RepID=A0ABU7G8A5_9ALTE|nr:YhdP family protein [Agarivorans aestuarii]MEE1675414.1 YhdP family protein [Agarivorans aestuarii]
MATPLRRGARKCWYGLAIVLVIIAVCLSIARGILSFASNYKDDLAQWLVADQDAQLRIGQLSARLRNFRPMLVFEDTEVAIGEDRNTRFSVGALMLELDLWETLEQRQVVFKDLVLDEFHLELRVDPNNSRTSRDFSQSYQAISNVFLGQLTQFSLTNSLIELSFPEHSMNFDIASLDWVNKGDLHQGNGEILIGQDLQNGRVSFRVDLLGDAANVESLTGKLFAKVEHLNLKAMRRLLGASAKHFESDVNLSLWAEFGAEQQQRWLSQWQPSQLSWGEQNKQVLRIDKGLIQGLKVADKWRIDKLPWQLSVNDQNTDFSLQGLVSKEQQAWRLAELDLATWSPVLAVLENAESSIAWSELLKGGQLSQLELEYQQATKQLTYQAELLDVSAQGQAFIPSLTGLNAQVVGDKQQANVKLQQQGGFHLGVQFEETWKIEKLDSDIAIRFADPGLSLRSQYTHLVTPELDFAGKWSLTWPKDGAWPVLSLMANAEIRDAGKAYWYYPEVMPGKVFSYLKDALVEGQAKHSQVLWYGQLNNYPYDAKNGIFQAFVPLDNATFKFDPDWPALKELQLDLLFQNDGLFMESNRARLGEVPAQRISASIPKFQSRSELFITGEIAGSAAGVQDYLLQSPIDALSDSLAQLPLGSGDVAGEIYLNIPLYDGQVEVNGHVDFNGNSIKVKPAGMDLSQVNGRLYFQNDKLRTNNLSALWRGMPLDIKFNTQASEDNYLLDFDLVGRWPLNDVQRAFGIPLREYSSGSLNWQGDLDIRLLPQGQFDYKGDFRSDLLGLALTLPEPMQKRPAETWPTALSISGDGLSGKLQLESNQLISAAAQVDFVDDQKQLKYALLNLGADNDLLWQGDGLAMSFDFAQLDLEPWLKWSKQQIKFTPEKPKTNYTNVSLTVPPLMFIRGSVDEAQLLGQKLNNLNIAYLPRSKTQLQIESEQLIASVAVPEAPSIEEAVKVTIEKAQLNELDFSQLDSEAEKSESAAEQPSSSLLEVLPPIAISCNDCQFGDYRIGNVKLDLPIENQAMENGRLWVDWGHSQLTAALFWNKIDAQEQAGFAGSFDSSSMEQLIEDLGKDSPLKGTPARFTFDVSWQDSLLKPQMNSLDGSISVKTDKGVVTEMSDKGTRLLTLASLDTIRRRLQLDFSDVFEKGLHFDSMSGSINFDKGVGNNQDFYLDGVAGAMRGKGEVDFRDGQIDYRVSYSPKVTSSLPVLAAFLVTPATGVAVLALSKLLEPVVEVVTQIDFALTGNLAEPELIELERVKQEIKVPDEFRASESRQ